MSIDDEYSPYELEIFDFTYMPKLQFTSIDPIIITKITNYLQTKIDEINILELDTYKQIIDYLRYDYNYYFKYIISYIDYCTIINSITNFNSKQRKKMKVPYYWNSTKREKIIDVSNNISKLLDTLSNGRDLKLMHIKKYSKKNKITINTKIITNL